jgi:hypothetical protein
LFLLYFYLYNYKSEIRNLGFDHESKKTDQTITPERASAGILVA